LSSPRDPRDLPSFPTRRSSDLQLMALVRKELLRPDKGMLPDDDAFRFRHTLIRDAAYEALPKTTRARLHERFADWLVGRAPELVDRKSTRLNSSHLVISYAVFC